jgi:hypothetical protein
MLKTSPHTTTLPFQWSLTFLLDFKFLLTLGMYALNISVAICYQNFNHVPRKIAEFIHLANTFSHNGPQWHSRNDDLRFQHAMCKS